jgi:hypothetical protein
MHAPDNNDFYRFTAAGTGNFTATVAFRHAAGDIDAVLYDANGNMLTGSAGVTDSEQLTANLTAGQTYYLRVYGYQGAVNPSYSLQLVGVGGAGDRFESNDAMASATNLGSIGTRSESNLSIHSADDEDYYRITAAATGRLTANVLFSHAAGDVDVVLYDAGGNAITSSASVDDNEALTADVTAGQTYYLRVYGYQDAVNPNYSLQLASSATDGGGSAIVTLVNGRLIIQGTEGPDDVSITGTGVSAQYTVSVAGQAPMTVSGVLSDIVVNLLGGDDSLVINHAYVNGKIEIDTGAGQDRVVLGNSSVVSTVTDLIVRLGDGNDLMDGKRLYIGRDQAFDAGAGNDQMLFRGFATPLFTLGTSAGRNVTALLGGGNDMLDVVYGFIVGAWTVDGGFGDDRVSVYGSAGSGQVAIGGGGDADFLSIDTNFFVSDVRISGDAGADELFLANGLGTPHALLFGGDGDDLLTVRNQRATQLTLDAGTGNDNATVVASILDRVFAGLGDGDDQLTVDTNLIGMQSDLDGGLGIDTLIETGNLFRGGKVNRGFELFS